MNAIGIVKRYNVGIAVRRWLATVIDYILVGLLIACFSVAYGDKNPEYIALSMLGYIVVQYLILEAFTGYTIGKFILRIKVVDIYGGSPGFIKGLIRTLFRIIDVNPFFFGGLPAGIAVLASKNKQRLGDMAAKTFVIKVKDLKDFSFEGAEDFQGIEQNSTGITISIIIGGIIIGIAVLGMIAALAVPLVLNQVKEARENAGIKIEDTQRVQKTYDGKYQVGLPSGWSEDEEIKEDNFNIAVSNRLKDSYFVILSEDKKEFSENIDLGIYYGLVQKNLSTTVENSQLGQVSDIKIGGYNAKQFEISGEVDYVKIQYLITLVETPNGYHQLMGWTSPTRYNQNKSDLITIVNSFKEVINSNQEP